MYRAEIIAVGDELLRGDVDNTTAPFITEQVRQMGYQLIRATTVGDEPGRIARAVEDALEAAEIVFLTGGLGPTTDDVTREALAGAIGRPLEFRQELWQEIQELFRQRGKKAPPANINQAYLPHLARAVPNPLGTARGIIVEEGGAAIIALPGPPHELIRIFQDSVRPYLAERYPAGSLDVYQARVFKVFGIGESEVMERLRPLPEVEGARGISFGFYPRAGEVHILMKTSGGREAAERLDRLAGNIKRLLGDDLYGTGEETLPAVAGALLKLQRRTAAVAESCTGGLIAQYLTSVPGSSAYFRGGIIAYQEEIKERLLGVRAATIDTFGVVSGQTAMEMASCARTALGSDYGIAATGLAGPAGGTPGTPVGTVYIGLAAPEAVSVQKLFLPHMGRSLIRTMAAKKAIDLLRRELIKNDGEGQYR